MGSERRRREAMSRIGKRKTDGRRITARGREIFKERWDKRKREIVVLMEDIRSLLEKLAAVAPCFEVPREVRIIMAAVYDLMGVSW